MDNPAMTVKKTAEYIGVCVSQLNKIRAAGDFPKPFKIGAKVLWRRAQLDGWLNKMERSARLEMAVNHG